VTGTELKSVDQDRPVASDHPLRRSTDHLPPFSVVVPCFNEVGSVRTTIEQLADVTADCGAEIIVVDDGSTDGSSGLLEELEQARHIDGLRVVRHSANAGYGASIKTGVRRARAELIVIIDADGSYPCDRIPDLVDAVAEADMVVGARTESSAGQPFLRRFAKGILRAHCSWLVGEKIPDMNSGLRVFRKSVAAQFFKILPDGFSLTTTLTVAMMRNRYAVLFEPIPFADRVGRSKIRPLRDTLGFIQLIVRTGMYFAPLRVLLPLVGVLSLAFAISLGYDIVVLENLTDKTIILLLFAMNTALFGLLADMIDKRS
jgi:glycosyltransferase involved in cell wall biosynthesis